MEELELYAYTTDAHKHKGLVKVGHCKLGRYKERIKEQFGTSNPEPAEYILLGPLPIGKEDKHVHALLIRKGFKHIKGGPGKEWFHATFDDVKRAYNEIVYGTYRTLNHKLRREQIDAIEKAKKWFLNTYSEDIYRSSTHQNRFLVNAKMRFGKCFTSIHLAKSISSQNTLIVTYKPDVIGEWLDAVNEHVDFNNWTGIRAKKKADRPNDPSLKVNGEFPECTGPIVLCVSLQDLSIDPHGKTKERLKLIPQINWDLVIFDEVHYGSRTERAEYILDNLQFSKRLDLSGTPFRLIEQDDFCAQQVYTYSYLDEQKNKKEEIANDLEDSKETVYRQLPDLNISTIEITEHDIAQQRETFLTDDLDFSLNTLFKTRDGKLLYDNSVDHFINGLTLSGHEARAISVFGKLGTQLGVPPIRHTVWWLNRVESITALIQKLKHHPYFSKFILINASGSGSKTEDDANFIAKEKAIIERKINEVNSDPTKLGTITLTCGRFLTGVTIREWDSILVLNDVQSAESYFQAIFRVQSTWVENKKNKTIVLKPTAWVFDFAITRCLKIVYDCANNIADQLDQQESYEQNFDHKKNNLEITVAGLCDNLVIKRFIEGNLTSIPTTAKDIFDVLDHSGSRISLARRITSNILVNFDSLKLLNEHPYLLEILNNVKGYRTQEVGSINIKELAQIGIDAEKLKEIKNDAGLSAEEIEEAIDEFMEKDKDKERQTRKKWYATQIKRLAICMADFIYMTYEREYNINDVIQTKSPEFFNVITGITKENFIELCEKGFLNKFALNRIVREFKDQEETSLDPEKYIFDNLLKNTYKNITLK
jgi:hypothetical protein